MTPKTNDPAQNAARKTAKNIFAYSGLILPNGDIDIIADGFHSHESAEIKHYREALEFYADTKTWEPIKEALLPEDEPSPTWAEQDFGHKARTALASSGGEGEK